MRKTYIIIDDDPESILRTQAIAGSFQDLHFIASAENYGDGLNLVLEHNPTIIFLEIDPSDRASNLSLLLINELHRYLTVVPKIIVITKEKSLALDALQYNVSDYLIKPLQKIDLRKAVLKVDKTIVFSGEDVSTQNKVGSLPTFVFSNPVSPKEEEPTDAQVRPEFMPVAVTPVSTSDLSEDTGIIKQHNDEKPLIICVKSYGDYRFIEAKDICYLQADNNSTDIHLYNGEMVTAFKTLKHFEGILSSPVVRIHNSYIVNIDYVSRIHMGNAVCYIKNTTHKLPFSKSYKENVDSIINSITNGNYLEI